MFKFDFSVITRHGQKVESIIISGLDQSDAERKLRQMYRYCEVTNCRMRDISPKLLAPTSSLEDILSMISR